MRCSVFLMRVIMAASVASTVMVDFGCAGSVDSSSKAQGRTSSYAPARTGSQDESAAYSARTKTSVEMRVAAHLGKTGEDGAYVSELVSEVAAMTRARHVGAEAEEAASEASRGVPVAIFRRAGRGACSILLTTGLGLDVTTQRADMQEASRVASREEARSRPVIELVAYADESHAHIADVLAHLGRKMRQDAQAGRVWHAYDRVALSSAIHNVQYFALGPGGEVKLANGLKVELLKVTPLTAEEHEDGERSGATQWVDPDASDPSGRERALLRWHVTYE